MNITRQVKQAHEKLAKSSTQFLEFVSRNPGGLKSDNFKLLELNHKLYKLQSWPTFINQQTKNEMEEASIKVLNLIKSIAGRIFSNDYKKLSDYYGIPIDLVKYLCFGVGESHLDNLLARGDFILSGGVLKCLEYNINANLGGLELPYWESLYLNTPIISEFLNRYKIKICNRNVFYTLLEHLLVVAMNRFPRDYQEMNIVIAIPGYTDSQGKSTQEMYYNSVYRDLLRKYGYSGGEIIICEYPQLNVSSNCVFYKNKRIHSIVEWYQGFVSEEILKVFGAGNVLIYNGPIAWLLSTKLNLALLSELEDSEILSREEREIIKKYIPWTRKTIRGVSTYKSEKIRLEDFILSNREKLVLKPLMGSGGSDIFIGRYTSEASWRDLVEMALKGDNWEDLEVGKGFSEGQWEEFMNKALSVKNWIVQEYVESDSYLFQLGENGCAEHYAVWGFFVFGPVFAGGWLRVLPKAHDRGIINCHQGAKVSVLFDVEE